MRTIIIFLVLLINGSYLFAQAISSLRLQQSGNIVKIEFNITGGNTCNGIDVFRSTDSLAFTLIGDISGICGSVNYDITYNFSDFNPVLNADNYYKLDLKELGFSNVVKIHVYDESKKLLINPNPVLSVTSIHYPYDYGHSANVKLINAKGKLVFENKFITDNPFLLEMSDINDGLYFLEIITNRGNRIVRKIIKE